MAQSLITLDIGGTGVRYADTLSTAAIVLAPALRLDSRRASLQSSGALAQLENGGWTTQGALAASLRTPSFGPMLGELAGSAGGSAHNDGSRTGQALGIGRVHLTGRGVGAWLGIGGGITWDGLTTRSVRRAEAASWARLGRTTALAAVTPTTVADTIRYVDSELAMGWSNEHLELSASAGTRSGARLPVPGHLTRSWGSVGLVAWVAPGVGIVAGAGTYPVDLTQGFPGGSFISLALRLRSSRTAGSNHGALSVVEHRAEVDGRHAAPQSETVAVPGGILLRVRARAARSVDVAGDFSDWQPIALTVSAGGWWEVRLSIDRGTHQLNVRMNGGPWLVPAGLASVKDEYGGSVGLLVVGQPE